MNKLNYHNFKIGASMYFNINESLRFYYSLITSILSFDLVHHYMRNVLLIPKKFITKF